MAKLVGGAAVNGAITMLTTHYLTPEFPGKDQSVMVLAGIGALKGMVNILTPSPVLNEPSARPQRRGR